MEMPNSTGPTGGDPFVFKDNMMIFPTASQMVPVENQEPHARQYCLAIENQLEEFNELLRQVFTKKALIWHLDKNWDKEGNCNVVAFYSLVVKKPIETGSTEVVKVGSIKSEIFTEKHLKNYQEKEDKLFDEFIKGMDRIKNDVALEME
jgi:hypothetical protein